MSSEPSLEQSEAQEQLTSLPFPTSWRGRFFYGLFITAMPVFSFWATAPLKPEWQDGNLNSYIILLLFPKASLLFFPLLAYSVICYWLLLDVPTRFSKSFIVRIGIYTGVLLALQYSIVVLLYSLHAYLIILLIVWGSSFLALRLYRLAIAKWTASKVNIFLFVSIFLVVLIGSLLTRGSVLFLVLIALVMLAPLWSLLIAWRAAIWLYKNHETNFTLPRGLGIVTWLAAYGIAWRYDILKMFELYAALPPQPPPDCYIATAAAKGHPRFVGSHTVQRADGFSMQVNGQLQRLKCAELALMAVSPRVHGVLRKIYDVVGKALARRMTNPYVADVAFLLLKPAEWFAIFFLKKIVPEVETITREMYKESNVFAKHPFGT